MRRKALVMLACAMLLCVGCQKAEDAEDNTRKNASEQQDKEKNSSGKVAYSPILSENDVDLENEYPYEIRVNRAANCITVYGVDDTGKYILPVRAMICSTGKDGVPLGTYQLGETSRWQMEPNGEFCQYATNIVDDITFHSTPYYSEDNHDIDVEQFNKLGDSISGSCIHLETADAKWIADSCPEGTRVEIYEDKKEAGPLGKPEARHLEEDATQDPTDTDKHVKKENDYVPVEFAGIEDKTIQVSESFDLLEGVTAKDSEENDLTLQIRIFGEINPAVPGVYEITYMCRNEADETRTIKRSIQVEEAQPTPEPAVDGQPGQTAVPDTEQPAVPVPSAAPQPVTVPTPEPVPATAPPQNTIVLENPFTAPAPTPVPTPEPAPAGAGIVVYYDYTAPEIEIVADSFYIDDLRQSTLEKRVHVTDNSGSIKNLYITVQPLSKQPYYTVIYEAEDAAGNTACILETVRLRGAVVVER